MFLAKESLKSTHNIHFYGEILSSNTHILCDIMCCSFMHLSTVFCSILKVYCRKSPNFIMTEVWNYVTHVQIYQAYQTCQGSICSQYIYHYSLLTLVHYFILLRHFLTQLQMHYLESQMFPIQSWKIIGLLFHQALILTTALIPQLLII